MEHVMLARHGDSSLTHQAVVEMYRLRHEVFRERLGWEVTSDNGMEHDQFDRANPVYVLVRSEDEQTLGCWRLLPTTGPNMLRDVFSQLLNGRPVPSAIDTWEISRFAVATEHCETSGFGFSEIPLSMMRASVRFAQRHGIKRYVAVTSVAVERMLRKVGINIGRLGPPAKIGRVMTVACAIELDEITEFALFGTLPEHAERIAA